MDNLLILASSLYDINETQTGRSRAVVSSYKIIAGFPAHKLVTTETALRLGHSPTNPSPTAQGQSNMALLYRGPVQLSSIIFDR
jgi:hypothetical protein